MVMKMSLPFHLFHEITSTSAKWQIQIQGKCPEFMGKNTTFSWNKEVGQFFPVF